MSSDAALGETVYCARHPDVETALECGRCGTPICPRCMVHTPGGIRCPDCARLRRPPMYEVAPADYLKAAGVAALLAPALGFVAALLLPLRGFGMFFLIFLLLLGSGAGTVVAEAIRRATNGKRGPAMQAVAAAAIVGAGVLRLIIAGAPLEFALQDLGGLVLVGAGVFAAWGRLR